MKFENVIEKYKREFQTYATFEDKLALNTELTTTELSIIPHSADNRWLETSFGLTMKNMRDYGYNFVGYCLEAPFQSQGRTCAIVFEDSTTFEKYWCHGNETIIKWWKEQGE